MAKKIFVDGLVSGYMTPSDFEHLLRTSPEDEGITSRTYAKY